MNIRTISFSVALAASSLLGGCGEDAGTSEALPSYQIVSDENKRDIKRSVDVILEGPVSVSELEAIAKKIKASDRGRYQRTFITYTLPNMQAGYGQYASTHYNPTLEVRFSGLDRDQTKLVLEASNEMEGETLGLWFDDTMGMAHLSDVSAYETDLSLG